MTGQSALEIVAGLRVLNLFTGRVHHALGLLPANVKFVMKVMFLMELLLWGVMMSALVSSLIILSLLFLFMVNCWLLDSLATAPFLRMGFAWFQKTRKSFSDVL